MNKLLKPIESAKSVYRRNSSSDPITGSDITITIKIDIPAGKEHKLNYKYVNPLTGDVILKYGFVNNAGSQAKPDHPISEIIQISGLNHEYEYRPRIVTVVLVKSNDDSDIESMATVNADNSFLPPESE